MNKKKLNTLGKRARYRREDLGIAMDKMAEEVGISQAQISKIETDKSKPGGAVFKRLAEILGVREEWLETGNGEMFEDVLTELTHRERRHVETLRKLPAQIQQVLEECTDNMAKTLYGSEWDYTKEPTTVKTKREDLLSAEHALFADHDDDFDEESPT